MRKNMKKVVSLILTMILVCALAVSVYAAEAGTCTVSVTIPDLTPAYTLIIPSDTTLEYGLLTPQEIGSVTLDTREDIRNCNKITVSVTATPLAEKGYGMYVLPMVITAEDMYGNIASIKDDFAWDSGLFSGQKGLIVYDDSTPYAGFGYNLYMTVTDWTNAQAGCTFSSTLTFNVSLAK